MQNSLTISLNKLNFLVYHGLYPEERKTGNEFEVNLMVSYLPVTDVITDIGETVNYATLFNLLKTEMQKPRELLETLVMEITELIHAAFPQIIKVEISVDKLHPPIAGFNGSVGVKYSKEYRIF